MKITDLLWILAYPIYQLLGTFRHEASHALVAMAEGAKITEFVFWPTEGYWGYVRWEGSVTSATTGAPYLCDLLTFVVFFAVCMLVRFDRRWIWLNLIAVGVISPLVNSIPNYRLGLSGPNDVGKLLESLPENIVHGYFWSGTYRPTGTKPPTRALLDAYARDVPLTKMMESTGYVHAGTTILQGREANIAAAEREHAKLENLLV